MRQRVAFLRTLLAGKPVLALDEPFASLDALTRGQMQEWLTGALEREPRTVLLVTHDVEEAVVLADRVVVMSPRPGRAVAEVLGRPAAAAQAHGSRRRRPARAGAGDAAVRAAWRPALLAVVLLGAWEAYARLGGVDDFLLPAPTEVAQALWDDRALLWHDFKVTAGEVLLGIVVAVAAGVLCAVALHFSRTLRRTTYPLLVASQTVPIVIVAPLLVVWLGYDLAPKLAIIGLICFFPITVTTLDGLGGVDPDLRKLMRTLDASRLQAFRRVEAPAALPALFSGAKIAVAVAVIGAVLAEQAGSSDGLGHLILQAIPQFETARAYAAVAVLSAFAIALFGALALAERLLMPWAHRTTTEGDHA